MVSGRCMRCGKQQEIKDPKDVTFKNGRKAKKGPCAVCGCTICKIVG